MPQSKKPSSRIIALDLMRGYFLLCMILDHLDLWPNGLDWVSARGELFVSSAEGFFLISGIVLGIVRGAKLLNMDFRVPAWLLVKRGVQLYITYVLLAFFFTVIGWAFFMANPGLKFGIADPATPLLQLIWSIVSFQYLYGWADYLRLYCIFLLLSPVMLWLLRKGKWWIVCAGSLAVWAFSPTVSYPETLYVQPFTWQLLFYGGMIIGFHWKHLVAHWSSITLSWRRGIVVSMVALSLITLAANLVLAFGGDFSTQLGAFVSPIRDTLKVHYFDKELLMPARLLMFLLWFWTSFWLFRRFESKILRLVGWFLLPYGTNSLYVYTVHAFLVFFIHLVVLPGNTEFLVNVIYAYTTLALIWVMIRYRVLFRIIPR